MKKYLEYFCVGCGLCKSLGKAEIIADDKGFYHPKDGDTEWLKKVCPAGGQHLKEMDTSRLWGKSKIVYSGWSNDPETRKSASSGGILTEICAFLLEKKIVDGVVQTTADEDIPYRNRTVISKSVDEVRNRCGSRYSISHPLEIIHSLDKTKRYAFVGKPCDIDALKNYMRLNQDYSKCIKICLSFFCMGLPSDDAQLRLINSMNCSVDNCSKITYRGNGWPGYATICEKDGRLHSLDYNSSWGEILGRDLMPACRFCADGIGELADISCGDFWYVKDNKPDFSEHEGRNVIFVRSDVGNEIINMMKQENRVTLNTEEDIGSCLKVIQKSQMERRLFLSSRIAALRLLGKTYPHYPKKLIKKFSQNTSVKKRLKVFF